MIAHRLMGSWEPTPDFFRGLIARLPGDADLSRPYPFCLAHPLEGPPDALGDVTAWQAEWKWDGIRAQLIRRQGLVSIWTRGEELVTERFPELAPAMANLPDGTVLDGEIVVWKDGRVAPFNLLQRRIGRKSLGKKILEAAPAAVYRVRPAGISGGRHPTAAVIAAAAAARRHLPCGVRRARCRDHAEPDRASQ